MLKILGDWDLLPIYAKIAETLKEEIKNGDLKPGDQLPTEEELCSFYDVSRGTIRKALSLLESEGIISRRQGVGSFVSSVPEKISSKSIGLIIPYMKYMGSDLLLGIERAIRSRGYHLFFFCSDGNVDLEIEKINQLINSDIKGIILYTLQGEYKDIGVRNLIDSRKPFVLIDRYLPHIKTSWVVSDNYNGGYEMTEYLIKRGHSRICFAIYSEEYYEVTSVRDRRLGYLKAMEEYELSPIVIQSYPPMPPRDEKELKEGFSAFIEEIIRSIREKETTAIFGINDMTAVRVMRALLDMGYRIPQDISIVGFDCMKILKDVGIRLTSVYQDFFQMGFEAGRLILEKINNPNLEDKRISIPIEIRRGDTVKAFIGEEVIEV
jgi:DNA-binding LacI/PurR family transcriptional regulator